MTKPSEILYFIATVPPQPLYDNLYDFKKQVAENYASKAALRSPPHITLHMPFKWDLLKEDKIITSLTHFCNSKNKFEIELKNFSAFPPRVVYVDILPNAALTHLQKELSFHMQSLQLFNSTHHNNGFTPHITIAFRDLKKHEFERAWNYYSQQMYSASFTANSICLLKHNGKEWNVYKEFSLRNN